MTFSPESTLLVLSGAHVVSGVPTTTLERKPRRQRPLAAHQDADHSRLQIVVGQAGWYPTEVREGPDVAIEKADLILGLVDPREVAAGILGPPTNGARFTPKGGAPALYLAQDFETSLREYLQLGKSARLTPRSEKEGAIVCFTAKVRLESVVLRNNAARPKTLANSIALRRWDVRSRCF